MKPFILLLSAAFLSTASLSACSESNKMSIQQQTEARFKLNPEPKQAYRVRIKINDAPGRLKPTGDMYIGYAARNCSYTISKLAGATASPEKNIPIKMDLVGNDEYEMLFYADAVLNEDYFGEGICRWQPENFGASFKATGKAEETEFNISDVMENLTKTNTLTKYYWKGAYPYFLNNDGSIYNDHNVVSSGNSTDQLDNFSVEQQKNLFTITVTLEKVES